MATLKPQVILHPSPRKTQNFKILWHTHESLQECPPCLADWLSGRAGSQAPIVQHSPMNRSMTGVDPISNCGIRKMLIPLNVECPADADIGKNEADWRRGGQASIDILK